MSGVWTPYLILAVTVALPIRPLFVVILITPFAPLSP